MPDRRNDILNTAADLLQTRSFSAISYHDLSERLGITKAGIHHHFPSKDDLGIALADHYYAQTKAALDEIAQTHQKPWDQFNAYMDHISSIQKSGDKICSPGIFQAEHNVISEGMRQGVKRLYHFAVRWITAMLTEGRGQGVMDFSGSPEDQATLIHAALQGALQNARSDDPKRFTAVVRQIKGNMKAQR